ncbi:MAG: hypothetical protein J6T96_05300 [Bacteroidales bacterium]|nr:hypothetical protein [Bacteroidales bacterium]
MVLTIFTPYHLNNISRGEITQVNNISLLCTGFIKHTIVLVFVIIHLIT